MPSLIACLALAGASAHAQDDDPQRATQEAQAKQKLEQVRTEIHQLADAQKVTSGKKNDVATALREQELKIAATVKELRALDQKLVAQQDKLARLETQRNSLDSKLALQREALATLLRSAYALGRNEELRLLLAQDDIGRIGRMLAYYRYFERARVAQIQTLLADLDELAKVQLAIDGETAQIKVSHDERAGDAQRLQGERDERRRALAELDAALKDEQSRLAALGKDEKGLLALLEKLRDIFADIPKQLAGAEPFAQLRGRLVWPVHGKIEPAVAPGEEGEGHGVLIAAADGAEVHAVSHGRVVFADWLRGFGLLLIVDHGDGYLSLYGYNETLLKDVGDWVNSNDVVATSGASGGRKQPGLYFELRHAGKPMDALAWLKPVSHRP